MKRDLDLLRRILLAAEELPYDQWLSELEGVDAGEFAGHVALLLDAGLVEGVVHDTLLGGAPGADIYRLTWAGHEFLDAARSDTLWQRAKSTVIRPGASFTFDLVKEWLKGEIQSGFPTLRSSS